METDRRRPSNLATPVPQRQCAPVQVPRAGCMTKVTRRAVQHLYIFRPPADRLANACWEVLRYTRRAGVIMLEVGVSIRS